MRARRYSGRRLRSALTGRRRPAAASGVRAHVPSEQDVFDDLVHHFVSIGFVTSEQVMEFAAMGAE